MESIEFIPGFEGLAKADEPDKIILLDLLVQMPHLKGSADLLKVRNGRIGGLYLGDSGIEYHADLCEMREKSEARVVRA